VYACNENNACAVTTLPNCCGNDQCEEGESFGNCPGDCLPKKLDFELLEPDLDENLFRGEPVLFRVRISGDGRKILSAEAKLSGFFGEVTLYNDGKHEDGNTSDGIYANRFFVGKTVGRGKHSLRLKADFRGVSSERTYDVFVEPRLALTMDVNKRYTLGDIIDLSGSAKKKSLAAPLLLNIRIWDGRENIFDLNTVADSNGMFSAEYHTSLVDRSGVWRITVSGFDTNNNAALFQRDVEVLKPGENAFLGIELLNELEESYERGSSIEIIAVVNDALGETVEGATVKLTGPGLEEIQLLEIKPGEYSGIYHVPLDLPMGEQHFSISAVKSGFAGIFSGSREFGFSAEKAKINIEVWEPSKRHYLVGENLVLTVFLSYGNGDTVVDAAVRALVHGREIELLPAEAGVFSANHLLGEKDTGGLKVSFRAIDAAENEGVTHTKVEVSGKSIAYVVQKNSLLIALAVATIIVLGGAAKVALGRKAAIRRLAKRRKELISLERELQKKYFEQGAVLKGDYETLMEKYESELGEVEKKLGEWKKRAKKAN
jgi:hypothetical protein